MSGCTIYHNPRCSKSRQTLALLEEHGIQPQIRVYMSDSYSDDELRQTLKLLAMSPRQLLRTKEAAYKELGLNNLELDDDQVISAMLQQPKLIERPIVICGAKAAIGRPPENVLEILP